MPSTPDPRIAVIGAGIAGAFAAYFLASRGARPVLLERERIAAGASGANAGGLNPLHGPGFPGPIDAFALQSLALHLEHWPRIGELSAIAFGGRRVARLHVAARADEVAEMQERVALYDRTPGFSGRWLAAAEARAAVGTLAPGVAGGLWSEGNARVEPAAYTRAVVDAARRLGATLVEAEATGLEHERGRVTGVRLGPDRLDCDGAVIATGPWCEGPQHWLGLPLPVSPVKGELLRVTPSELPAAEITSGPAGVYFAGADGVWLGGTEDRAGFDATPTADARRRIGASIAALSPALGRLPVQARSAALRPVTPDHLPIIGIPAGWENVCVTVGGGRKGMLLSSGMGLAASQLLLDGRTELGIGACTPERWRAGVPAMASGTAGRR